LKGLSSRSKKAERKIWLQGLTSKKRHLWQTVWGRRGSILGCKRIFDLIVSIALFILFRAPDGAGCRCNLDRVAGPGHLQTGASRALRERSFIVYKFSVDAHGCGKSIPAPAWAKKDDGPRHLDRARFSTQVQAGRNCPSSTKPSSVARWSFIGPRPERQYFVDLLKDKVPYYDPAPLQ